MYKFFYNILSPYWQDEVHLQYLDADSFLLSLDTNKVVSVEFLKQNKDEFGLGDLDKINELYDTTNMKNIGKMKIKTSAGLVLNFL